MGKSQKLKERRKIEKITEEVGRKKEGRKIKLIIGAIIVILVLGVVTFFLFGRINKEKNLVFATIETAKGNIKLELDKNAAPKTVENFVKLSREEFYNGTKFHRVEKDFVVQAGDSLSKDNDPTNDGQGGPGYLFDDEINPKALGLSDALIKQLEGAGYKFDYKLESIAHQVGVISMANAGPNTNGSQFFIITTKDQPNLDGRYTAFGRVISGMDVVREIEQGDIINKITINN